MKITRAFFFGVYWMVQREDGKYAVASDSDVSVGDDAVTSTVLQSEDEWFNSPEDAVK